MKNLTRLLLLILLGPTSVLANAELVQIVNFKWNEATQKLEVVSFGSGTAIAKNLVMTNKHVIKVGSDVADFLLLCPAQAQESRSVKCNVEAGVSAIHRDFDAALVRTIDPEDFLPSVRASTAIRSRGDTVRVVGFPIPDTNSAQNFGGTKTKDALEQWLANPTEELVIDGDKPTTTRGEVLNRYILENTGAYYTHTDAKVNFGNSGGAAFDQFGAYIGIPTLKDQAGNSFILEYAQMHDWVNQYSTAKARYEKEAYTYYESLGRPAATSSQPASTSARARYFQQLRERYKNRNTIDRRTTSRRYSSPYSSRTRR